MFRKPLMFTAAVLLGLFVLFTSFTPALASTCGETVVVQRGDTLSKIALRCDVTLNALLRANPTITNPNLIVPGQVIVMPGATLPNDANTEFYYVRNGDTLKGIAIKFHTTVDELLRLNPEIRNPDMIKTGQRLVVPRRAPGTGVGGGGTINAPAGTQVYTVQPGDTLKGIAIEFGTTKTVLRQLNPQITNPDLIRVGQQLLVPIASNVYIVQRGDTLGEIALRFNTTVAELMRLNPEITNPNLITPGQVIRFR
ncbi:MAG: LysM peptidoglycan-binding domain-containing protein [Anaerolineales bacterium]|nr:LysM peptidoglycan-binding domain-containing protein [Anaerolineales bacterium]